MAKGKLHPPPPEEEGQSVQATEVDTDETNEDEETE